ncbi:MAG: HDOD domain-containing protein [Betaproteobacteria bacterium]|nr:HDOD domain-containing protein [Betaproteobacteria bacterium]
MTPNQPRAVLHAYPLINAKHQYGGMRIVIDNRSVDENDVRETLALVSEVNADATYPLIVAFADDCLPFSLGTWQPPANTLPEFRGEWLTLPAARDMLSGGNYPLWCLNAETERQLDPALLKTLRFTVSPNASGTAHIPTAGKAKVRTGLRTHADAAMVFAQGIDWVAGWPLQLTATLGKKHRSDNRAIVLRLLQLAQNDADISELEDLLKQDAGLAFKLLRTINSAANGLSTQVQSFQHAVMLLGYKRLTRWLAVLLLASSEDPNQLPLMNLSLRRGFFMERIGMLLFDDINRDEPFMTGLFSLLDLIFAQPLGELLDRLYLPEAVSDTLRNHGEPYGAMLRLTEAIEGDDAEAIRACTNVLGLTAADVNRALLLSIRDTDRVELR